MSRYVGQPEDTKPVDVNRTVVAHDVFPPAVQSFYTAPVDYVGGTRFMLTNDGRIVDRPELWVPSRVIARRSIGVLDEYVAGRRGVSVIPSVEETEDEPEYRVQIGYQTDESGNDTTALYHKHSPIRFRQFDWPGYTRYFPGTSTSYHGSLLELLLEHFRRGTLETSACSWLNSLNMNHFYPAGETDPRFAAFTSFPGRYLLQCEYGKTRASQEFHPIDHIVDWTGNHVIGIGNQYREVKDVTLLEYGAKTRPAETRHEEGWDLRCYPASDVHLTDYSEWDLDVPPSHGMYYFVRRDGSGWWFSVWYERDVEFDEYVIPGGTVTGSEIEVKGGLYLVDRSSGALVGWYMPGYRIFYYDESNYCDVSVDEWNQAIFEYHDGPYAEYEFNIPLLAEGGRMIVVRYLRSERNKPHPKYDTSLIYTSSVTVRFFLVDYSMRQWKEIFPLDYVGKQAWPSGGVDPSFIGALGGNFCFVGDDPNVLITPWVYGGRLYIHGPTGPLWSTSTREFSGSDIRLTTMTCGSNILSYPLTGGLGSYVHIENMPSVWSMPTCRMVLRSRHYAVGDVSIEMRADMNRMFVGDKNFKLRQTSEV